MSDIKIEYHTRLVDDIALQYLKDKLPETSFSHHDIWFEDHAVTFTVAKMMEIDLLEEVQKHLTHSLEQGKSFRQFKKDLLPHLIRHGWWGKNIEVKDDKTNEVKQITVDARRLKLIFETNIRTAQAKGLWERIWKNRDFFPYLEYIESTSDSQREQHLEFVGLILPVEHPFWDKNFPPNGYNCKCSVLALTKKDAIAKKGEDGLKADLERANRLIAEQIETENPRQKGRIVRHHATTTPSFAYNPAKVDRQAVLNAVFIRKYGWEKWEQELHKAIQRHAKTLVKIEIPPEQLLILQPVAANKVDSALEIDPSDKTKRNFKEAEAATAVANKTGWRFERTEYSPNTAHADFVAYDTNGNKITVDFMYVVGQFEPPIDTRALEKWRISYLKMNERLATETGWEEEKINIEYHTEKANKVLVLLSFLTVQNCVKILQHINSLAPEKQKQFIMLDWEGMTL